MADGWLLPGEDWPAWGARTGRYGQDQVGYWRAQIRGERRRVMASGADPARAGRTVEATIRTLYPALVPQGVAASTSSDLDDELYYDVFSDDRRDDVLQPKRRAPQRPRRAAAASPVIANFRPDQLRDPHTGEWIDEPGAGELVRKMVDKLVQAHPEEGGLTSLGVHGDLQREQVAAALHHQFRLTPGRAARLKRVSLPPPDAQHPLVGKTREKLGSAFAMYGSKHGTIVLHPDLSKPKTFERASAAIEHSHASGWLAPSGADSALGGIVSHEYGHHIHFGFLDSDESLDEPTAARLLPLVAHSLGLSPPPSTTDGRVSMAQMDEWIKSNAGRIRQMVSQYGAENSREFFAELWGEFSTMGEDARPYVREIGELMRQLAEERSAT